MANRGDPGTTTRGALPLRMALLVMGLVGLAAGAAAGRLTDAANLALAVTGAAAALLVAATWLARPAERLASAGAAREPDAPLGVLAEVRVAGRRLALLDRDLRGLLAEVAGASAGLAADARTLRVGATQQAALASRQAAAVVQTGTTATEIAQTAKAAMTHAEEVLRVAQQADELSGAGQQVLERTIETIRDLAEEVRRLSAAISESAQRSRQIGEIVGGLKDLAENTNLLAINASIEAVKAGDEGRGFAVVAAEMGNLAELSLSSANEVRGILQEIELGTRHAMQVAEQGTRRAHGAVELAAEAGRAIAGLTTALRDSSVAARQIANNTRQQGIGVEQIVAALGEMSAAAQDAVAGTQGVERTTASLAELSGRLDATVARFRAQEHA